MSMPLILIVVVCIVSMSGFAIIWIARQKGFTTKQTVDPVPQKVYADGERKE
ncbi:hypothetical protein [Solibacillus sp. CAU 1738]|uniref:hypothetical protein n=1 Tax=Solibacillus sp. CAU 1738 TaxID=3140363 RepID=UPI0032600B74